MTTEQEVILQRVHFVPRRTRLSLATAAISLVIGTFCAQAAEPDFPDGTYKYITLDQSVGDALTEFGRNVGIPVKVSSSVKGRVGPGLPVGSARQFLDSVSSRYGLVWYFDGSAINVSTEAETRTELFKLDEKSISGVTERLDRLGINDPRFPIRVSQPDQMVSVSGPPTYLAQVKKTLGVMSDGKASAASVRVFRGRRAESLEVPASQSQ